MATKKKIIQKPAKVIKKVVRQPVRTVQSEKKAKAILPSNTRKIVRRSETPNINLAFLHTSQPITIDQRQKAILGVIHNAVPTSDFYAMLVCAAILTVCGLFLDNTLITLVGLAIAPISYPVLGLGLGLVGRDGKLIFRSTMMLILCIIIAFGLAYLITSFFPKAESTHINLSFTPDFLLGTLVAVTCGIIASYAAFRTKMGDIISRVSISAAIFPALVVSGMTLVTGDKDVMSQAGNLFLMNLVIVLAASIIMFLLFGFAQEYAYAVREKVGE